MPQISNTTSLLEIAVAANAIIPAVISDLSNAKNELAETVLAMIRDDDPNFTVSTRDYPVFVDVVSQMVSGLKAARLLTTVTHAMSVGLTTVSIAALCLSALYPELEIPTEHFLSFVAVTVCAAPAFYLLRSLLFQWLTRAFARHALQDAGMRARVKRAIDLVLKSRNLLDHADALQDQARALSKQLREATSADMRSPSMQEGLEHEAKDRQ